MNKRPVYRHPAYPVVLAIIGLIMLDRGMVEVAAGETIWKQIGGWVIVVGGCMLGVSAALQWRDNRNQHRP